MTATATHTDLWWPYGPQTGRYTFTCSGHDTDGRMAQVLASEVRGAATPLHIHHDTDESILVITGSVSVAVGDDRVDAGAGDYVLLPMGVAHAWTVTSDTAKLFITVAGAGTTGPAGYGLEGFFTEVCPPVVDGVDAPEPALPDPEVFARLMITYGIELVGPPPFTL